MAVSRQLTDPDPWAVGLGSPRSAIDAKRKIVVAVNAPRHG
jgi:hypothetical protein